MSLGRHPQSQRSEPSAASEPALQYDQEALLRLAQQFGGIGTFDWDFTHGIAQGSAGFFSIFGLPAVDGSLSHEQFQRAVHPEDREQLAEHLERAAAGQEPPSADYRIVRPDGQTRWLSYTGKIIRDEQGQPLRMLGTLVDVTQQREAERNEALLAAIVESSDDAIISKTLDGVINSWNPGAERLFGYTAEEAIGKPILLIIPPDRHDEERQILQRLRRGERIDHYETERVAKNGRRIDISLTSSPIHDASGRIIGASKTARDITQRKADEKALREADRRKSEFLALLGHELRNPLAAVVNGVQILHARQFGDDEVRHVCEVVERQAHHMTRLIDDLLDVTRISRGKIKLRKQRLNLIDLLQKSLEDHRNSDLANDYVFDAQLPERPLWIEGDSTRLSQIFGNLLHNACKFTDPGGSVTLRASEQTDPPRAQVVIADSGIGIGPEDLLQIFEPFSQAATSEYRGDGGLGLGLALVKGLVELHDGLITAHSRGLGQGAEFHIELPLAPGATPQAACDPSPARVSSLRPAYAC